MLLALALLFAAPTASNRGPWLEMQTGPMMLHESGRTGFGTGPMVRFNSGLLVGERAAAELWLQGSLESAPLAAAGDRALVGGGVAGRLRLSQLTSQLSLWARGGAGWLSADNLSGPTGFVGTALMFQPFVSRFNVGVEVDALAGKQSFGFAFLPSLRCLM